MPHASSAPRARALRLARLSMLAVVACAASVAIGCGAKVEVAPTAARDGALRSFGGTVTDAQITWSWSTGSSIAAVSTGQAARFDVRVDEAGNVELVALSAYGGAVRATGTLGDPTVVSVPTPSDGYSRSGLAFSGTSSGWSISESYDRFEIVFDAGGAPASLVASGRASGFAGDVGTEGTVKATIALSPDATAPAWRATAAASFADRALPWDTRLVEASEPYEGAVDLQAAFPGASASAFDVSRRTTEVAWGSPAIVRERGLSLTPNDWDAASALAVRGVAVKDLAGNVAQAGPLPLSSIRLDALGQATLPGGANGATRWGSPTLQADCGEGRPCTVLGPFRQSYCGGGSAGGLAARLLGAGRATFRVRVTAKSTYGGGAYGPTPVHLLATNPGRQPVVDESISLNDGSGGDVDTGWKTVTLTTPDADARETGVAVSAGGKGAGPVSVECGPAPAPVDVTVYVGEITIGK